MTRLLPVPLTEVPDRPELALPASTPTPLRWLLARSIETALPVVGEFLRQRLSSPREEAPPALPGIVLVESVSLRLLKRADGTREWQLEHVTIETPRRSWHPGRWVMLLSLLAGAALAVSRVGRTIRR
ncbi:hypothetical protein NET03_00645 [Thermomicrobium sp. CFH 73360]|uniref:hypothetical protein n=1 Tax=Thermomicrobium sp. CFH 73360 TaxID=2951987 RepID=UPI00207682E4|nr:hypothetical protein [Thermomicrobium sp. CFH 73360]MCM8745032.1 hypothetical protein [Thermomicrobium sp. CFH 73360]